MNLGYSPHYRHTDEQLEAVAREFLEAMECLLYLMGKEAASPELVKLYVAQAKKALLTLHIQVDRDDATRRPYLVM